MEHQIRRAFHLCFALVDDHEMSAMEHMRQLCCRTHLQRLAPNDQAVRRIDQPDRIGIGRLREIFTIQRDVRPNDLALYLLMSVVFHLSHFGPSLH